jgi:hypothetical protein
MGRLVRLGAVMPEKDSTVRTVGSRHEARDEGLVAVLVLAVMIAVYWLARYNGYVMEIDASRMTQTADGIVMTGMLVHDKTYPAGFVYPATVAMIAQFTGLSVQNIQLNASIMVVIVALCAYVCYGEFLNSPAAGALACLFLLIQPDFCFYILRSSHEKVTWGLALMAWFLLARHYRSIERTAERRVFAGLFCIVFWTLATTNVYFAATFLFGLSVYLLGGVWTYWRCPGQVRLPNEGRYLKSLAMIILTCSGLLLASIHWVYPPAQDSYQVLRTLGIQIKNLFLGAGLRQPYDYVAVTWISPAVYALLTAPQWGIVLVGMVGWWQERRGWMRSGAKRASLAWMYLGFGLLLGVGVLADFSGFLSANLQVRWFPAFALVCSPVAAESMMKWIKAWGWHRRILMAVLGSALAGCALVVATLKVTNEPTLSNQWLVYTPAEMEGMRWIEGHLRGQRVWTGMTAHQVDVFRFWEGYGALSENTFEYGKVSIPPRNIFWSRSRWIQAQRYGMAPPGKLGYNRVYDNGAVQVWRRRAMTVYQK